MKLEINESERRYLKRLVKDCLKDQTHSMHSLTLLFELDKKLTNAKIKKGQCGNCDCVGICNAEY